MCCLHVASVYYSALARSHSYAEDFSMFEAFECARQLAQNGHIWEDHTRTAQVSQGRHADPQTYA